MNKPLVYIAGPYTRPDPVANTRRAILVWQELREGGLVTPIVPHTSLLMDFIVPMPFEKWLEYDFEILRKCDAVFRIEGKSYGAGREVREARFNKIPVFTSVAELNAWAKERAK